jgi:hypothetical protein
LTGEYSSGEIFAGDNFRVGNPRGRIFVGGKHRRTHYNTQVELIGRRESMYFLFRFLLSTDPFRLYPRL